MSPAKLGARLRAQGEFARAEPLLRAALAGAEAAQTGTMDGVLVAALNDLGLLSKDLGRYEEAREHYLRALALLERRGGGDPDDVATLYHNLGGVEHARGDYAVAEVLARRGLVLRTSLGRADDCLLAADQVALAAILDGLARHDEAERLYLEAVATFERSPDNHELDMAVALSDLGAQDAERGRLQHASERLTRALELKRRALGRRHPDTAVTLNNLAVVARRAGALDHAAALSAEALGILAEALPAAHPRLAVCRRNAEAFAAANGGASRDRA